MPKDEKDRKKVKNFIKKYEKKNITKYNEVSRFSNILFYIRVFIYIAYTQLYTMYLWLTITIEAILTIPIYFTHWRSVKIKKKNQV